MRINAYYCGPLHWMTNAYYYGPLHWTAPLDAGVKFQQRTGNNGEYCVFVRRDIGSMLHLCPRLQHRSHTVVLIETHYCDFPRTFPNSTLVIYRIPGVRCTQPHMMMIK